MAGRKEERVSAELRVGFADGEGITRNVSASGIYFVTASRFDQGQPLELHIEFPDFPGGGLEVTCFARVVRVAQEGTAHGVGAAISSFEFRRLPAAVRQDN